MPLYDFACDGGHRFERFVPLAQFGDAQTCACGAGAWRLVSAPMVVSDCIAPRMGADGRLHDSLASYRHSLTPEGNKKGERYFELGHNEELPSKTYDYDQKQRRDDIRAAMADVRNGNVPQPVFLED
ncbi:FmdB family zinc ribbon protein [Sphingopyxis terrae]|uniref:FmdB family zinc ribbon protein n=1 Tax=Sphingopyxis terrae TaxID=33052 RepID=UPI00078861B1|nr:FmdB family zinc ribbon protein [Sphingopyxis terrae]